MRAGEIPGLWAVAVVSVVAVLGGAFAPADRVWVGLAMAVVAVLSCVCVRRPPVGEEWVWLLVVLSGAVAATLAVGYPLAAKEMLGGWLVSWILWLVARRIDEENRVWAAMPLIAASFVVAAAVLVECIAAGSMRHGGLFINPNVAAAIMVPAIPSLWLLLGRGPQRRWCVVVVVLLVSAVAATGSRAGLLALVMVVGLMLPAGRVRVVGIAAAAAAAIGLLGWRFLANPDSLAWHRLEIWRSLWSLVARQPIFGVGPGWIQDVTGVVRIADEGGIARYGHIIGSAESTPFGILVRTGFVGLGLAALGMIIWWRRAKDSGQLARPEVRAITASVVVLALFHDYLDVDFVLWWWVVLVGVASPLVDSDSATKPRVNPTGSPRVVAGLALAMVVLWTIAQPAYARHLWWSSPSTPEFAKKAIRAETWYAEPASWRVGDLLSRDSWSWETAAEAIDWSRRASDAHPGSWLVLLEAGRVHGRVVTDFGPWPDSIETARDCYRRSADLEPHLPWAWLQWARLERSLGNLDQARRLAQRAVTEEPNCVRGQLFLARLALDAGDSAVARAAYQRAHSAFNLGQRRDLTDYQRDLLRAPLWQVEEIARELSVPADSRDSAAADLIQ